MKISIIIPVYNEEKTVKEIIDKVMMAMKAYDHEVIAVNDGSSDRSLQILNSLKNVKVLTNAQNRGKGYSIRKALKFASGDIIILQDADLEYDPYDLPKILHRFNNPNIKVIYGSRVLGKNPVSHWTFNLGGRVITYLTNLLYKTDITDEPTGYKVIRRQILKKINLRSERFEFCPELTTKIAKQHITIYEVPIHYNPRAVSEKKIKWYDGITAIFYLIIHRFVD